MNKIIKKILAERSYLTGKYCLPPEFLSLIITFKCNFQCQSCSIWKKKEFDELTEEDWLKIIQDLKGVFEKNTFVEINGGEPLIEKDLILTLIKELKKHFNNVALNSNGLLMNEKMISELENTGLDIVKVSFYSLEESIHNFLRGNPLAYNNALNALKLLSKSKIKSEVGILITSKNIKDLPELIGYLNSLNNTSIILQPLDESVESPESKNKDINELPDTLWPKKEEVNFFFDWILNNRKNIKNSISSIKAIEKYYLDPQSSLSRRCFAGQKNFVVYPNGDAAMCFKGEKIGNLKKESVHEILFGSNAIRERKYINHCRKYCRIIGCNFARGLKEIIKGK
ncbi:MAG: radical SAM protein [Candidatus Pacebacteria bacterium]|nr:radical SAM protein [Candidatus Paceibacterota bacterium]